jgi:hypothetical protein
MARNFPPRGAKKLSEPEAPSASVGPTKGQEWPRRIALLERYCVERKRDALKRGIRELLIEYPDDPSLLEQSLEWLWRAGLQRDGIKLALPKGDIGPGDITPEKLGRVRALWLMLCLIGQNGWPYAAQWLGSFEKIESSQERRLLAGILVELGDYERAWRLLQESRKENELQAWIIRAFTAWRGFLETEGDLVCRQVLTLIPKEDRVTAWWITCLQSYFRAKAGDAREGLRLFISADGSFPHAPTVAPRLYATSRIWLGLIHSELKDFDEARKAFALAEDGYRNHLPDYVPVRVLDLYYWKSRVMALADHEYVTLLEYPGPAPYLRRYRAQLRDAAPAPDRKKLNANWVILPKAGEYQYKGRRYLGIPLEIRLLATLKRARDLGIHRNLLKALLWPKELRVYFQLDGRLTKLMERLRHEYGFDIIAERDCYRLSAASQEQVDVEHTQLRPSFLELEVASRFSWKEVADYYGLGPTQARAALTNWIEAGWIRREGGGRLTRYRVEARRLSPDSSDR